MGKNKAQVPTLPRIRYMSCFDLTHTPVATTARATATGPVSMSTRPDPEGSDTVEIAVLSLIYKVSPHEMLGRFSGGTSLPHTKKEICASRPRPNPSATKTWPTSSEEATSMLVRTCNIRVHRSGSVCVRSDGPFVFAFSSIPCRRALVRYPSVSNEERS